MPTLNDAVVAIERHLGFPQSRVRQLAQRLGTPPEISMRELVALVMALAADVQEHDAVQAVEVYRDLAPGGCDVPGDFDRAGKVLEVLADIAAFGDGDLFRREKIEFVATWPEISILDGGRVRRFVPAGSMATHWAMSGHRRATTVDGAAFIDCVRALFARSA